MELGLNLFWLLLTIASFAFWGRRRSNLTGPTRPTGRRPRLPVLSLIALGSAVAILFPIISVTDDLHAEQAVLEDSSPSKRSLRQGGHSPSNSGKLKHPVAAVFVGCLAPATWAVLADVTAARVRAPSSSVMGLRPGRAPPRAAF